MIQLCGYSCDSCPRFRCALQMVQWSFVESETFYVQKLLLLDNYKSEDGGGARWCLNIGYIPAIAASQKRKK